MGKDRRRKKTCNFTNKQGEVILYVCFFNYFTLSKLYDFWCVFAETIQAQTLKINIYIKMSKSLFISLNVMMRDNDFIFYKYVSIQMPKNYITHVSLPQTGRVAFKCTYWLHFSSLSVYPEGSKIIMVQLFSLLFCRISKKYTESP